MIWTEYCRKHLHWRAPIIKTDDGDEVQIHQEEKVFLEKEGISDAVYISDNFVYYNRENLNANYGTPCIYSIKKKKWMKWPKGLPREMEDGVLLRIRFMNALILKQVKVK